MTTYLFKDPKTNKIITYTDKKLYNYGINKLAVREYTRQELFKKMVRFQTDHTIVNSVLDKLELQDYLNDGRRAKSLYNQFYHKESITKLKNRMQQEGIAKDIITDLIDVEQEKKITDDNTEGYPLEMYNAYQLLIKKYHAFDIDKKDRMVRFLCSRGYKYDDINKSLALFKEKEV